MRTMPPLIFDEALRAGLRKFRHLIRNAQALQDCYNLAPHEVGLVPHEPVISLASTTQVWPGIGALTPPSRLRTLVIHTHDFFDGEVLAGVSVYLDGELKGTTDTDGELSISDVLVGGHLVKLVKSGYADSDEDAIANDFILVT